MNKALLTGTIGDRQSNIADRRDEMVLKYRPSISATTVGKRVQIVRAPHRPGSNTLCCFLLSVESLIVHGFGACSS